MTPTDDTAATRLLADYRRVAGSADTIAEIGDRPQNSPEIITVLAQWLTEVETRWPGPETKDGNSRDSAWQIR
ncbi:hypothetical protein ACFWBG_27645 [Nocardia salmonicida]|uniref:hypothetical protein n=1 Tax=Nocardia salmonicida TaxID=53431 RepID=UPI00366EBF73